MFHSAMHSTATAACASTTTSSATGCSAMFHAALHSSAATRSAAGCPAACSATLCHRHIGKRFTHCLGAFLHLLVVLHPQGFALLFGFQAAHLGAILSALLGGHQLAAVNHFRFLCLVLGFLLNLRLLRGNGNIGTEQHAHRGCQCQQYNFWFLHNSLLKIRSGQEKIQTRHDTPSRAPHKMRNHHTTSAAR